MFIKTCIVFLALAAELLAVSNSVTVTELTGSAQTSRPFTISRVFAQGEIASYAQPRISGTPLSVWQCDRKSQWPDGSLKHALISFTSTLAGNAALTVDFVNNASSSSAGSALNQSQMLAFDPGTGASTWGGDIEATAASVTQSANVRTMLAAGNWRYWLQGPVVTQVIVEDRSSTRAYDFGWQCTGGCTGAYGSVTWSQASGGSIYQSLHPIFVVTFYNGWAGVQVDSLLENPWADRLQDQAYSLVVHAHSDLSISAYTHATFWHNAATRWRRRYWDGATPGRVKTDLNTPYLIASHALANWDQTKVVGCCGANTAGGLEIAAFKAAMPSSTTFLTDLPEDLLDPRSSGEYAGDMGITGGRPEIGPLNRWDVRWLYTQDEGLWRVMIGNANATLGIPVHIREARTDNYFLSAALEPTPTTKAFGHFLSIDARPTGESYNFGYGSNAADHITMVGTNRCDSGAHTPGTQCTLQIAADPSTATWSPEPEHFVANDYLAYLATGDWVFLEEQYEIGMWGPYYNHSGTSPDARGGSIGYCNDYANTVRAGAWPFRNLAFATFLAAANDKESAYLGEKLTNNIAVREGHLHVGSAARYYGTAAYTFGDTVVSAINESTTYVGSPAGTTTSNPWAIPAFNIYSHCNGGACPDGRFASNTVNYPTAPWEDAYEVVVEGMVNDFGYAADKLMPVAALTFIDRVQAPGTTGYHYNPYLIATYVSPGVDMSNNRLSGQTMWDAWTSGSTWHDMTAWPSEATPDFVEHAYNLIAQTAIAFTVNYSDSTLTGQDSWNWITAANSAYTPQFGQNTANCAGVSLDVTTCDNPKWALVPRSAPSPPPTAQSIVVSHLSSAPSYSIPNAAPFAGLTNQWIDYRIHSYSIPFNTCLQFAVVGWTRIDICDPTGGGGSGGGIFKVSGLASTTTMIPPLISPPSSQILAATATNPMILTLQHVMPAVEVSAGKTIQVWGASQGGLDPGCTGMNALQTVTAVSGNQVTIAFNGTGCAYASGGAYVYGQDFVMRIADNHSNNTERFESWNVDGSGYTTMSDANVAVSSWTGPSFPYSNNPLLPTITAVADIGYIRWCAGTIAPHSAPPQGSAPTCSGGAILADWEFNGNGNDSGPNALNVSPAGSSLYVTTPTYAPGCSAGTAATYRAGATATFSGADSVALNGLSNTLTYFWQQLGSTEPGLLAWQPALIWSGQNTVSSAARGTTAGPLNVQLTVTDSSGQSAVCTLHNGVVATDINGNIVMPTDATGGWAKIAQIMGPALSFSAPSPRWPFQLQAAKLWGDLMGQTQGEYIPGALAGDRIDRYNIAGAGTVSIAHTGNTVTGTGTNFQVDFCGGTGNTTPTAGIGFVGWYTYNLAGGGGGTGRRVRVISSCDSATQLTLAGGYEWSLPTQSGMSYAIWVNENVGAWTGQTTNINYYGNTEAFWFLYLATGIDTYLNNGRWLADRWWTMPYIDRGNPNGCTDDISLCTNGSIFPRLIAYTGLYLRAIDQDIIAGSAGASPMWAGIRQFTDGVFRYGPSIAGNIGDLRETAFQHMHIALCAAYDPNPTHAAACRADVATILINTWQAARRADGHWQSFTGEHSNQHNFGWDNNVGSGSGTVTVAQGSSTVTLAGGTWDPSWFPSHFFSMGSWNDESTFDTTLYTATYFDSTRITISPAYQVNCALGSNSCSGRSWATGGNWVGPGVQPFMLGPTAGWFNQASIALSLDGAYAAQTALAKSYVVDAAKWVAKQATDGTGGTDPNTRGPYYGVGYGVCTPGVAGAADGCRCGTGGPTCDGIPASRDLDGEALGAMALGYGFAPSAPFLAAIDDAFSAVYAKYSTDPGYDTIYSSNIDSYYVGTGNPKWFGFFNGQGRNGAYMSARQGGVAALVPVAVQIPIRLANVANATEVAVTVVEPNGAQHTAVICTATGACSVSVDTRGSSHLYQVDFRNSSHVVIQPGELLPLYVP